MRKEIEKRLGTLATHESTLAQTLEQMRKNTPQDAEEAELHDAEMEALLADPEARSSCSHHAEASRKLGPPEDPCVGRAHAVGSRS